MKNIPKDNETNTINNKSNNYEQVTDTLLKSKGGHSLLECNKELVKSYDLIKSESMGHKSRCSYRGLLNKSNNNVTHEPRSQSLPNSLDIKNQKNGYSPDSSDNQLKLLPENESPPESPSQVYWFKTWPECNKNTDNTTNDEPSTTGQNSPSSSKTCDNISRFEQTNCKQNTFTLNEALQSISLAYSPVTKQLHLVQKDESPNQEPVVEDEPKVKLGHRRTEAGSFSSTVSSLSDPSPSGSLLDADERAPSPDSSTKSKRKGLSSFFNRYYI